MSVCVRVREKEIESERERDNVCVRERVCEEAARGGNVMYERKSTRHGVEKDK